MMPYTPESYNLLHEGAIALAEVESNGIRIDTKYLDKAILQCEKDIQTLSMEMGETRVARKWRKVYGRKTNYNSSDQLSDMLFNRLGFESKNKTDKGANKTDEQALSEIDDPFIKLFLKQKKLGKALSTYLIGGIRNEVQDGFLHPFFNLHTTLTYRSSSNSPNFQNVPVRNEEIGRIIRQSFISRIGNRLVEIDFKGAEVSAAACYHHDPNMITYIKDKSKDMHRDCAMDCYLLPQEEITKQIRYCGKNMFVFPQFYGDWYIDCARSLWEAIHKSNLVTTSGTPLQEHLLSQGIRRLGACDPDSSPVKGTFEYHIQQVERAFWNDRFPVYARWKKEWYEAYRKRGYVKTLTGFVCQGYMKRNEVINYPVQGSAFHWLLWSLTQLVRKELKKRKMKTLIVGQIHDSIIADVPDEELHDFIALAEKLMTKAIRDYYKWIIVPLEIEAEVSPLNGCWADKAKYKGN